MPPPGISHEEAQLLVSKALDGEASPEEERLLAQHLERCPQCRESAHNFRGFLERLDKYVQKETPPEA